MKTSKITDKTYTLNSQDSYYDLDKMIMKIFLPEEIVENPYQYRFFDVSQTIDGIHQNAIFIYMKKTNDDASDLSGMDDDRCECGFTCEYKDIIPLTELEGYSAFDLEAENTLITIYHDSSTETIYQQACAEKFFTKVAEIMPSVIASNGNFQTTLSLMGEVPKTGGISLCPRKR